MTKRIPEPRAELSPGIRNHEARLLATMLRTSRLTCVFGEPGTDKSALLKTGVMPLLQRRYADRHAAAVGIVHAYPGAERRAPPAGPAARPLAEAAIYFDSWGGNPLAELLERVDAVAAALGVDGTVAPGNLAESLRGLHRAAGLRIVFLLDRFEEFLARPADQDESGAFTSGLIGALLDPALPASFLIALDEAARPRLERLRARIPGYDHNSLRLSPIAQAAGPAAAGCGAAEPDPASAAAQAGEAVPLTPPRGEGSGPDGSVPPSALPAPRRVMPRPRPKHLRGPPPREAVKVDDVYALIEQTLARTSAHRPAAEPGTVRARGVASSSPGADAARPAAAGARTVAGPSLEPALGTAPAAMPEAPAAVTRGAAAAGDEAAQRAIGTFRLAAALGRLRSRTGSA